MTILDEKGDIDQVSVPIRGLFNLTIERAKRYVISTLKKVSVPIRGLFNLTNRMTDVINKIERRLVSVPIRGLFNLTIMKLQDFANGKCWCFRPHQGII